MSDAVTRRLEFSAADDRCVAAGGHDVAWARTDSPGATDNVLLDAAEKDGRILLTLDKDFWQIATQRREPLERSGVILFRVHPATPENITPLVLRTMRSGHEWSGRASVVTVERVLMVLLRDHKTP